MGHKGDLVLEQSLAGAKAITVSDYSTSSSETAQISDGSHYTTAYPQYTPRGHTGPICPEEQFHKAGNRG